MCAHEIASDLSNVSKQFRHRHNRVHLTSCVCEESQLRQITLSFSFGTSSVRNIRNRCNDASCPTLLVQNRRTRDLNVKNLAVRSLKATSHRSTLSVQHSPNGLLHNAQILWVHDLSPDSKLERLSIRRDISE